MQTLQNRLTVQRKGDTSKLEITNTPYFGLRAYNSFGKEILLIDGNRLLMRNVSKFLHMYTYTNTHT